MEKHPQVKCSPSPTGKITCCENNRVNCVKIHHIHSSRSYIHKKTDAGGHAHAPEAEYFAYYLLAQRPALKVRPVQMKSSGPLGWDTGAPLRPLLVTASPRPPCTHRLVPARLRTHRPFTTPSRSSAEPTAAQFRLRPFLDREPTPARTGLVLFLCVPSSVPGSVCFGFSWG